jgi:hypothetical protein
MEIGAQKILKRENDQPPVEAIGRRPFSGRGAAIDAAGDRDKPAAGGVIMDGGARDPARRQPPGVDEKPFRDRFQKRL